MALTHRQRHRVSTSAHKHSENGGAIHRDSREPYDSSGSVIIGQRCFSSRKSAGFYSNVENAQVPPAIKYLEQVTFELSVTKKHADVRYLMLVRHHDLNIAWCLARSFDEYRKLRQRLLKKLQHGHFCDANCPWLYGFLKSDFPKKRMFLFSSARMIEERKQTLERFLAALYEFLTDRKNFRCSFVMTGFADEIVAFVYGDALQQHGLANPVKLRPEHTDGMALRMSQSFSLKRNPLESTQTHQHLQQDLDQRLGTQLSLTFSLGESIVSDDIVDDERYDKCKICGFTLSGVAGGNSFLLMACEDDSKRQRSSSESPYNRGLESITANGCVNRCEGSRQGSSARRRRAVAYYLTTLSCGHQFHDECIVPKLNESLICPTCGCIPSND